MYLSGEFVSKEALTAGIRDLKSEGFGPEKLAIFSQQPAELADGVLDRPSRMSFVVIASAITFLLLIIGFVYYTQYDYPLITGGMPLFSVWATGVVFYEIMMFGAIAATFCWFLAESGLLWRRRRAPVPAIVPGVFSLRVFCASDQARAVGESLQSAGAANVRTLEETA